jgi:DNA mismatch repair protein MutS
MSIIKEYLDLTKKYIHEYGENTLVLMQIGAFYEVYALNTPDKKDCGSKIYEMGEMCDLSVVDKKQTYDGFQVLMSGFRDYSIDKYLKKIQSNGYTIIVYSQKGTGKNVSRYLDNIYSPGTYFSNDNTNISNITSCIWTEKIEDKIYFGISNIDIYTGKISLFEHQENYIKSPTTYDELERILSIYIPSEIIIIHNLNEKEIEQVVSYLNVSTSCIHYINLEEESINSEKASKCCKQNYQQELFNKFYKISDFNVFIENIRQYEFGIQSLCFLLDFIDSHNNLLIENIKEPIVENNSKNTLLANHTLKQLNIINNHQSRGTHSCVLNLLNKCMTPMGKREFKYNLLNPVFDVDELNYSYNCTDYFIQNPQMVEFFTENLRQIKDIEKLNRLFYLKTITPQQLYTFFTYMQKCENIIQYINNNNSDILSFLSKIFFSKVTQECNDFIEYIKSTFNINFFTKQKNLENEINYFNKNVFQDIDLLEASLSKNYDTLTTYKDYFTDILNSSENKKIVEPIKFHETEKSNITLVCTKKRGTTLKNILDKNKDKKISLSIFSTYLEKNINITIDTNIEIASQTSSNFAIVNDHIKKISQQITNDKNKLDTLINLHFSEVIEKLVIYQDLFDTVVKIIIFIDCYVNKANIALKYDYCKPEIKQSKNSYVEANDIRHCLIERIQQDETYVPNNIRLNSKEQGTLLYGTNAVGKTSLIRSIGIAIIMAQSGLYVPCSQFVFSPYKKIFSRILNNDNLFRGLSTFAVEMSELRMILNNCDNNTLILGDELCSGTEVDSAISIFVSGIQYICKKKSSFLFATHLHQVVDFEEIKKLKKIKIKHLSVYYDKIKDALVYDRTLKDGPGNNMYGLEVCKSMHLPIDFMDNAYNLREKYSGINNILNSKESHYNNRKIMGLCEICKKNNAVEVHHLQYQQDAVNNKIEHFHKNHKANLVSICDICHDKIHKENTRYKKTKTTEGYIYVEL